MGAVTHANETIKTINRGFGGSKLQEVAYYLERLIKAHQNLKGVFLYVGNDIVGNNTDKTALQDLELVKYITEVIRTKYPTIPIFWNQISPSEKDGRFGIKLLLPMN